MTIRQIINWPKTFEGAKSKTYNNKTSCQMPTKHGLGYRRLIRRDNGAAIFGAWCALIQVLSRHNKDRQGYCTDTGRSDGKPYTSEDLELLTDIPAIYFDEMFDICSSQSVDWIKVIQVKDTTGISQGTIVPLDLDSDLDSDLNSDSDVDSRIADPDDSKMIKEVINLRPEFKNLRVESLLREISNAKLNPRLKENHEEFLVDMIDRIKIPDNPVKTYGRFLQSSGAPQRGQSQPRVESTIL